MTVAGQIGLDGILAANPVVVVFKNAPGAARNLRPIMAGKPVKEQQGKVVGATHIGVLVSVYITKDFGRLILGHFSHFGQVSDKNFGRFAETSLKQIYVYETRIRLEKRMQMMILLHSKDVTDTTMTQ